MAYKLLKWRCDCKFITALARSRQTLVGGIQYLLVGREWEQKDTHSMKLKQPT